MEPETPTQLQQRRDFVIPGCEVLVQSGEKPISMGEFLALAFHLSGSNPDAQVEFCLKVTE